MCDISKGKTLVRDVQRYVKGKKKLTYQKYYTFYKDGYSLIFKDGFRRAYIFNKDGSFNEIINLTEHVASDGSLHKHNNLVDYFRKMNFNIEKQQYSGPNVDLDISMKTRENILGLCGLQKGMEEFTDIMNKYSKSMMWPSLLRYGGGILDIDRYLKSIKEKLEKNHLHDISKELHDLMDPDPKESYWNEIDVSLNNNMVAILLRLYTLSIRSQYQEYDYIMFQVSNYLIAGDPDINIKNIYLKLQDERLEDYKLKIFDVDDKLLIKIINMFSKELAKISPAIDYLSNRIK